MTQKKTGTLLGVVALALALGTAAYWFYLAGEVALPDDRTGFVLVFLSAAALGIFSYFKGARRFGAIPPAGAIIVGLFLPFTIFISPQEVETTSVIKVGDIIPAFSAPDEHGVIFDSTSLKDDLVLIKFFRAHW